MGLGSVDMVAAAGGLLGVACHVEVGEQEKQQDNEAALNDADTSRA